MAFAPVGFALPGRRDGHVAGLAPLHTIIGVIALMILIATSTSSFLVKSQTLRLYKRAGGVVGAGGVADLPARRYNCV